MRESTQVQTFTNNPTTKTPELEAILKELKPYERKWCNEIQADIVKLPHGYLLGSWDSEKDVMTSYCFVPSTMLLSKDIK